MRWRYPYITTAFVGVPRSSTARSSPTASLRTAFGNAVDDPDSQLNKIHTVLLNRELGDVDTLA